jgi:Zn-finger nucleic acid-binding protein
MIVVEHENIELDYCTDCSGVWFDAGELELLLESMELEGASLSLDSILTSPEAKSSEKKRKCPICRQKMKKATVGHEPEVLIDACQRGDGLWFDKGEVGQLITQLADKPSKKADSQGRIITFLGEVFRARD